MRVICMSFLIQDIVSELDADWLGGDRTQSIQQVITLLEKAAIAKKKITIDGMLKGSALAADRKPAISEYVSVSRNEHCEGC